METTDMQRYLQHIITANKALEDEIRFNLRTAAEKLRKFKDGDLCKRRGRNLGWHYIIEGIAEVKIEKGDGTKRAAAGDEALYIVIRYRVTWTDSQDRDKACFTFQEESAMVLVKRAPKGTNVGQRVNCG
jgi:hypothetical protein